MNEFMRFSLSLDSNGNIEVYSFETGTKLLLPETDKALLIVSLSNFHQTVSELETIYLDPSLKTCET